MMTLLSCFWQNFLNAKNKLILIYSAMFWLSLYFDVKSRLTVLHTNSQTQVNAIIQAHGNIKSSDVMVFYMSYAKSQVHPRAKMLGTN